MPGRLILIACGLFISGCVASQPEVVTAVERDVPKAAVDSGAHVGHTLVTQENDDGDDGDDFMQMIARVCGLSKNSTGDWYLWLSGQVNPVSLGGRVPGTRFVFAGVVESEGVSRVDFAYAPDDE